jgi:signal transduction histidine kinase
VTVSVLGNNDSRGAVTSAGRSLPADVWHDLVHEIATVRALTSAAKLAPDNDSRLRLLGLIDAESAEINSLLRQLRPGVTGSELVDVAEVARGVIEPLAPTTPAVLAVRAIDVEPVVIDRASLRRILRNLIGNAVRAAGAGRVEVRVGPTRRRRNVVVEVADSGPGFGHGPAGLASQGLSIVLELATAAGCLVKVGDSDLGGAAVSLILPTSAPS